MKYISHALLEKGTHWARASKHTHTHTQRNTDIHPDTLFVSVNIIENSLFIQTCLQGISGDARLIEIHGAVVVISAQVYAYTLILACKQTFVTCFFCTRTFMRI